MYGHLLMCDERQGSLVAMLRLNRSQQWNELRVRCDGEFTPCDAVLAPNNELLVLNFAQRTIVKLTPGDRELRC